MKKPTIKYTRSESLAVLRAEAAREKMYMNEKHGFDNEKYLQAQKAKIEERLRQSDNKLYIEFGGKLLFDFHAARILPGYDPNVKIQLLQQLSSDLDIILCVNANDIEKNKLRADFGITYMEDVLKIIDDLANRNLKITAVVITRFSGQSQAASFKKRLENSNIRVYTHPTIPGYPNDIDKIVSDEGYGACEYIETTKKIVVVTAPGPGSGKLATCLSQLYHEYKRGIKALYSKFETFPVWDLPLKHPINVAYEAATLDLNDANMVDSFHQKAYGTFAVNYNRDIEAFPLLQRLLERITNSECPYKSPTDMGCNCISQGIIDDSACSEASKQETIRRYLRAKADFAMGYISQSVVDHSVELMKELNVDINYREVIPEAKKALEEAKGDKRKGNHGILCGAALQLPNGDIITGTNSPYFHSATCAIIKACKRLAGIPESLDLLSPIIIQSIGDMKGIVYQTDEPSLDVRELLVAFACQSPMNPSITRVFEHFPQFYGCEMHLTHIPSPGDQNGLRKLGIRFTYDPIPSSRNLLNS